MLIAPSWGWSSFPLKSTRQQLSLTFTGTHFSPSWQPKSYLLVIPPFPNKMPPRLFFCPNFSSRWHLHTCNCSNCFNLPRWLCHWSCWEHHKAFSVNHFTLCSCVLLLHVQHYKYNTWPGYLMLSCHWNHYFYYHHGAKPKHSYQEGCLVEVHRLS